MRPHSARPDVLRRILRASAFTRSSAYDLYSETVTFKTVEYWPANVPGHTVRMSDNREGPVYPRPRPWPGTLYDNHSIWVRLLRAYDEQTHKSFVSYNNFVEFRQV